MTYKDIKINQYLELCDLLKESDDLDLLSIQVKEISIVFGISEDEVLNLPLPDYQKKVREISFLSQPLKPCPKKINSLVIGDRKFNIIKDVKNMTAGQFVDYNTFIGMNDKKYTPHILSVFVVPEGKKYGEYDQDEHIEFLSANLDIQTAYDICFFFLHKLQNLLKAMELYLGWEIKKNRKKIPMEKMQEIQSQLDSLRNGIGYITSIQ